MTVFIESELLKKYGLFDVSDGNEMFQICCNEAKKVFTEKYGNLE